jgi:hypothetical protein
MGVLMNKVNNIEKIDQYINDTQWFIEEIIYELEKKENNQSNWYDVYNIAMYYKDQIIYNIDKYEIYCRALRDKLNEPEIF